MLSPTASLQYDGLSLSPSRLLLSRPQPTAARTSVLCEETQRFDAHDPILSVS